MVFRKFTGAKFWILVDFYFSRFLTCRGADPCWALGRKNNLRFYPKFAISSTLGETNLDNDFFHVSKLSADQKQGSSPNFHKFFSLNSSKDKKKVFTEFQEYVSPNSSDSHADHSQIIGGDANVDLSQIIGGMQSTYWGKYIPHPSRFRHACLLAILLYLASYLM